MKNRSATSIRTSWQDGAASERSAKRRFLIIASLGLWLGGGCVSTDQATAPANAIHVGSVLPFSGSRAASGVALESALRLGIEKINSAGGLGGRPLWLDVADSHSDDARGTANALQLIDSTPMSFFIGTEEPTIAYQITSAVKAHQLVQLMPGLTAAQFHDPSASAAWFRLSPSPNYVSCALAKRLLQDGMKTASVVMDPDDYSNNFATRLGRAFFTQGGTTLPNLLVAPNSTSYGDTLDGLIRMAPDAAILVTAPSIAAGFLQEWAIRGKPVKLYLGPTLNTPELLRNLPAGILEGVAGISADLGPRAAEFDAYFQEQTEVLPITGSHYYFDAIALLALAVAEGIAKTGAAPNPVAMREHMLNVSSGSGTVIWFDQLAEGLAALAAGQKIEYRGAAGSYVLDALGDSTQVGGAIWRIAGTEFQTIDYQQCTKMEVRGGET